MDYKLQQDQLRIQSVDTSVILAELISRALIMSKPKNTTESDNLLARLSTFAQNVNGGVYAPKDPFELQELTSYATKVIAGLLTEEESHKYLNLILDILAPGGLKDQLVSNNFTALGVYGTRVYGADYMNAINKFLEFVRISNIPRVDSFDRFKAVYEKCITINPDIDKVASNDLNEFFMKCRECGLR